MTVKECGSINWISFDAFLISVLSADRFTKATPSRLNLIAKFSLGANWYIRNFRQPRGWYPNQQHSELFSFVINFNPQSVLRFNCKDLIYITLHQRPRPFAARTRRILLLLSNLLRLNPFMLVPATDFASATAATNFWKIQEVWFGVQNQGNLKFQWSTKRGNGRTLWISFFIIEGTTSLRLYGTCNGFEWKRRSVIVRRYKKKALTS